jgi:hypothetical protein
VVAVVLMLEELVARVVMASAVRAEMPFTAEEEAGEDCHWSDAVARYYWLLQEEAEAEAPITAAEAGVPEAE